MRRTIGFLFPLIAGLSGAFIAIRLVGLSAPWYLRASSVFVISYFLYAGAKYILNLIWKKD
ncbi:MAG: hypothetical protein QF530_10825 [SAR202 cluster bacterium]|nr:hypothetical protein [SAR202 cluster bacterium]